MNYGLYSIYDKKSELFGQILTFDNDDVAIRYFRTLVADESTLVSKYPEDFCLFGVGLWNNVDAIIEDKPPCKIFDGIEFMKGEKNG